MLMDFKALFEESGVWSRQWKWRKDDASSLLTMRTLALLVFVFWLSIAAPTLLSPATVTVSVLEHSTCDTWLSPEGTRLHGCRELFGLIL